MTDTSKETQPDPARVTQEELLPCPFCGGVPEKVSSKGVCWPGCLVACDECDIEMGRTDEQSAIAAWNSRLTHTKPSDGLAGFHDAKKQNEQAVEPLRYKLAFIISAWAMGHDIDGAARNKLLADIDEYLQRQA